MKMNFETLVNLTVRIKVKGHDEDDAIEYVRAQIESMLTDIGLNDGVEIDSLDVSVIDEEEIENSDDFDDNEEAGIY